MSSYLGQSPVFGDFPSQILTGDGTADYTLNYKSSGTNGVLVFLNGAVQRPGIDYSVSGQALTFQENVAIGVQILTYGMGLPKSSLAPSAGSVGSAELASDVYATVLESQDWTNMIKLLSPKGLDDAFKGTNQSLATAGYQKLPGGLIIQWGTAQTVSSTSVTTSFPVAFPNECLKAAVTHGSGAGILATGYSTVTTTEITLRIATSGNSTIHFIALGY